ncbi:MAG: choice-of-anchor D domain-containing protein [Muribaculaceae bacterium]|nr:choice-of-anchor D domain-containing protein [Muribaculaceae bacterium]
MKKLILGAAFAVSLFAVTPYAQAEEINIGTGTYDFARETEREIVPGVKYTYFKTTGRGTYGTHVWITEVDLTNPNVKIEYHTADGNMGGTTATLANIATANTSENHKVVAGANANFWVTTETPAKSQLYYYPFGTAVSNGLQFSVNPPAGKNSHIGGPKVTGSIAIGNDGRAYIKRFNYFFYVQNPRLGKSVALTDCNRLVETNRASIYNSGYGRNKSFKPVNLNEAGNAWEIVPGISTEVLCDLAEGETATVGGDVKYVVKEIRLNAGTGTLGNHDLAIVGRDNKGTALANYAVGDEIILQQHFNSLDDTVNDIIPSMYNATSGNDITMEAGEILTDLINKQSYNGNNYARTLYGTNDDGTKLWIAVCGNKTGEYTGMTTIQMTNFLKHLGATYASQVDCGGSAQMYVYGSQVNNSTDGSSIRPVHSGMFVVYTGVIDQPAPVITSSSKKHDFGEIKVGASKKKTFTIEGSDLQADIKVSVTGTDAAMFSVTPSKIIGADQKGTITVTYAPTAEGAHTAKIKLSSTGATNVNITVTGSSMMSAGANVIYQDDALAYGIEAEAEYTTEREYQDYAIGELEGKTFKRVIARGDIVYILAHDESNNPTIVVFNHVTKKVLRTLGTAIATVGNPGISDIAITADGTLVGMGYVKQGYNGTSYAQTFKWAKDENGIATGEAVKWFLGNNSGNWTNAYIGESMLVQGDINTGKIIYTAQTTGTSGDIRYAIGTLNGDKAPTFSYNKQVSGYSKTGLGEVLTFPSPFNENNIIIQGSAKACAELEMKSAAAGVPTVVGTVPTANVAKAQYHTGIFRYGGKIYMTTPTSSSGQINGVRLVDITDGLANAQTVTLSYKALTKKEGIAKAATVGTTQITMKDGQFVEARLVILALRDGKLSKFITKSTITDPVDEEPSINSTAPMSIDFEKVMIGSSSNRSYTVEGLNLKDDITLKVDGEGFSVSPAVISKDTPTATYQITFSPTAKAKYSGTLTIATTDAEPIELELKGAGVVEDPNIPQIEGDRGHHAYNLSLANIENEGVVTGARINFHLTGDVRNVKLHLYRVNESDPENPAMRAKAKEKAEVQPDYTMELGELKAGENSHDIDFTGMQTGKYDWKLEVESYIVRTSAKVFQYAPGKTNCNGGVTVITDHNSPAYGKIVASNGYAQGFMVISPTHEYEGTYCANTATWMSDNASSTYRIAARDNGVVYAADFSKDGAGAWAFDPANPEAGTYNIFSGTKDADGCWTLADGTVVGGRASGIAFAGNGDATQLWMFQNALSSVLCRYDIGNSQMIEQAPVKINNISGSSLMLNANVSIFVDEGKGLLLSQTRGAGNNNTSAPSLVYATFDGNVIYNSGSHTELFANGSAGGVALNADRTILALGTASGILLYDVEWDADGKPTLSLRETSALPASANARQLVFDNADNLIAYQQSADAKQSGVNIYAIGRDERVVTHTPAPVLMSIDDTITGVENIELDETSTTPVFYNIHGVRMPSGDDLLPGLYLKVTGKKIEKVIIR